MNISIIGTGIYSIALALNIINNCHKVIMWSENKELVKNYQKKHNLKPITNAYIPDSIIITNDLEEALSNSDLILIGTSSKYVRSVAEDIKKYYNNTPICIASKGIENNTCYFMSDIIKEELKAKHISVISGPTFAIDLINKEPCALSVSGTSKKAINTTIKALKNNNLKLRSNNDLFGTELCGSIKNVIAISSGILDGLGFNESTRAFLINESLHDIKELLLKLECNPKTVFSFAGIGDLILTSSSNKSRNYRYGVLLGKKASLKEINNYLKNNTTEGYYTLISIKELIKRRKINVPLIEVIYDIAINKKDPLILKDFLINKE